MTILAVIMAAQQERQLARNGTRLLRSKAHPHRYAFSSKATLPSLFWTVLPTGTRYSNTWKPPVTNAYFWLIGLAETMPGKESVQKVDFTQNSLGVGRDPYQPCVKRHCPHLLTPTRLIDRLQTFFLICNNVPTSRGYSQMDLVPFSCM